MLTGCGTSLEKTELTGMMTPTVAPSEDTPTQDTPAPRSTLEVPLDVSLDVMIGQMLMIGFRGLEVNDDHFIVGEIREHHLGGVILFDYDVPNQQPVRNVESPSQLRALVSSLRAASEIPLLVAIDHEGGIVTRLKEQHGFPSTASHQSLGEANDLEATYEQAYTMAETLAELGVNLNLAPVVDVNTNPDNPIIAKYERSFSADPAIVTGHALEFIKAHHEQGILCTLKHFPGHGSSADDSHLGMVDVTATWSAVELEPYAEIINTGQADAIMTAHVFNGNLDPDHPATLSQPIVTGVLREELGYEGVVLTDDMQMLAVADHFGFEVAIQRAIEAGVDGILCANNSVYDEEVATRAIAHIKRLVDEGTISRARIRASYQRMCALKSRLSA
jgi:beta-N-acetylhexosaminidase